MSIGNFVVPPNVFELEDNDFFEFVKLFAGEKLSSLVKFQDISNAQCLLDCDDPFEILLLDSNDLLDLQKQTCIKLKSNGFVVLPGLISKMKILKGILLKKRNELKKKSIISLNINATSDTSLDNAVINNNVTNLTQLSVQESINTGSPIAGNYADKDQLKQHLINLIDNWCMTLKENENQFAFCLKQDTDYQIMIDLVSNKVLIKCQCGAKSVLGQKSNRFILSNFIRHLTQKKPCDMVQQKLININQNTSVNDISDDNHIMNSVDAELTIMSNPVSHVFPLREKRKRNQSVKSSLSKKGKSI